MALPNHVKPPHPPDGPANLGFAWLLGIVYTCSHLRAFAQASASIRKPFALPLPLHPTLPPPHPLLGEDSWTPPSVLPHPVLYATHQSPETRSQPHFPPRDMPKEFSKGTVAAQRGGGGASEPCIIYACVAWVSFGRDMCTHLELCVVSNTQLKCHFLRGVTPGPPT